MYDAAYNNGWHYFVVEGRRFRVHAHAAAYAGFMAIEAGRNIHVVQFDHANPAGFILETYYRQ